MANRESRHIFTYQIGRWAASEHFYDSPLCNYHCQRQMDEMPSICEEGQQQRY